MRILRKFMSTRQRILEHDRWRRSVGGGRVSLVGHQDFDTYANLNLDLINFGASTFTGSRFSRTTFRQASWMSCQFEACVFNQCDFDDIRWVGCTFVNCVFEDSTFRRAQWSYCTFMHCELHKLCLEDSHWLRVAVLDSGGTKVQGANLKGRHVEFIGSTFADPELQKDWPAPRSRNDQGAYGWLAARRGPVAD